MLEKHLSALVRLGALLAEDTPDRARIIEKAGYSNPWFTRENVLAALEGITASLRREAIETWLRSYGYGDTLCEPARPLNVGLILAGNIPLVGFHDILCVLVSGHRAVIK